MNYAQTKSIKVDDITHKHLQRLGRKGQTFANIIAGLIQEHLAIEMQKDIRMIHNLCEGEWVYVNNERQMTFEHMVSRILGIFDEIDFDFGIYPDWEVRDALETAMDEDMIGAGATFGDRDLPFSEVVTNVYCLYLEMPSPTTGLGAMIPPLAPH